MFTGTEDQSVSLSTVSTLNAKWRLVQGLGAPLGHYFSKSSVEALLGQTDAVGVRLYFGFTSDLIPKLSLSMSAVKANGDDITSTILNSPTVCPPNCSTSNDLNS